MSRRLTVCAVLFGVSTILVAQWPGPVLAQTKESAVEKQLRADLAQSNRTNTELRQEISQLKQEVNQLKSANAKLQADANKTNTSDTKTIKDLQTTVSNYRNAGLIHVVILKLKSDSPTSEVQSLTDDVTAMLAKVKVVRGVWVGPPSASGTPSVATTDYTVAIVVVFDDATGLKTYLDDPLHKKFADKHLSKWETPVVYDFEPKKPAAP
jgi:TolA-binding protein